MQSTSNIFSEFSERTQYRILKYVEFETLLICRLVCSEWNELIATAILPHIATLQINLAKDSSHIAKQFRKGKWFGSLVGAWKDIHVHFPAKQSRLLQMRYFAAEGQSPFNMFTDVTHVTLYMNRRTYFPDLICSLMAAMPQVKSLDIRESPTWEDKKGESLELLAGATEYTMLSSYANHWNEGMANFANVTNVSIKLFSKIRTLMYMSLVAHSQPPLQTLKVDFSRMFSSRVPSIVMDELHFALSKILLNCLDSLKHFTLNWNHRVEEDADLLSYAEDHQPFLQFVFMLSSNLQEFSKLRLETLTLGFPCVVLFNGDVIGRIFIPFLVSQEKSLQKLYLFRVRWDSLISSLPRFLQNFSKGFRERLEFGVFTSDLQNEERLSLIPEIKDVEYYSLFSDTFDLQTLHVRKTRSKKTGTMTYKKHNLRSLRFRNSDQNPRLEPVYLQPFLNVFKNLQELELIDHNVDGVEGQVRAMSNEEFNTIFLSLPRLSSVKLTNLSKITDSGITLVAESTIEKLKNKGVLFPIPKASEIPILHLTQLKYLELRDLSSSVTDITVFFALQFLPKLQCLALYGDHKISDWGKLALKRRQLRHPCFDLTIERTKISSGNYIRDFP